MTFLEKLKLLVEAVETNSKIEFHANNTWHECDITDYISGYLHFDVRLKPDAFKELKEAYANGKIIQISSVYADQVCSNDEVEVWDDCTPQWAPNRKYRVKPEPVDLDVSDITIHTILRNPSIYGSSRWFKILRLTSTGVYVYLSTDKFINFKSLNQRRWEMSEDNVNWKPCNKII